MENPNFDCDWEFVPNSDEHHPSSTHSSSAGDFGGVIRSDYFSLDSGRNEIEGSDGGEGDEVGSDDPNWVDPDIGNVIVSGNHCGRSSSDSNSSGSNLMYSIKNHSECCGLGFSGFDHLGCSKSSEIAQKSGEMDDKIEQKQEEDDHGMVDDQNSESIFEVENEMKKEGNEYEGEDEKKRVVWWKVPMEVLKYCVMRVNPVWSLSMAAAALMGFVILRRRFLYKMKRKSLGIQLNVTVDDKVYLLYSIFSSTFIMFFISYCFWQFELYC
ncbi:hypothetical protein RND81_02G092900 [Saponaria officinalis]|uniref:Transmembrane protein n=1 Tax=Saponaria officinalis TaxID=3572 RepID=A0AAW1MSJ7_SAPOF